MKKKILSAWLTLIATFFVSFVAYADTQTIAPNGYSGNNIYLPDQRVKVTNATSFPYNTIVDIHGTNALGSYQGTGVLIAPGVVLTAGHVVYNKNGGGYANSVTVYRAYANGDYNPSTGVSARSLLANPDWIAKNNASPSNYISSIDLGLIYLNQNMGMATGWMGISSNLSVGQRLLIAGFPGDHQDQMWSMSGNASAISSSIISYTNISVYKGQSGSPIVSSSNNIMGINVAQANYFDSTGKLSYYVPAGEATNYPNAGVQMTSENIAWIQNNVPELKTTALYRLYNPGNSDHLYTKNLAEMRSLATSGWSYEGVNSQQPASGNPVYRLYNRVSGEHFLTMASGERSALLQSRDWSDEGIAFYSDSGQHTPEYRLFNPAAPANKASHFWTSSLNERNTLVSWGWRAEGIGWYGL